MEIDIVRKKELLMEKKLRACRVNIIPRVGHLYLLNKNNNNVTHSLPVTSLPVPLLPPAGLALPLLLPPLPVPRPWRRPPTPLHCATGTSAWTKPPRPAGRGRRWWGCSARLGLGLTGTTRCWRPGTTSTDSSLSTRWRRKMWRGWAGPSPSRGWRLLQSNLLSTASSRRNR